MKRLCSALLVAVLIASCGGQEQSIPTPTSDVTTTLTEPLVSILEEEVIPENKSVKASILYTPETDGFGFENFGGGQAPAELTVNMTRRFYGDNQVCSDVTNNECTPYPVILQLIAQANRSMQGGLCEGLTVLSLRLANDLKALTGFQDVNDVFTQYY